MRELKFQQKAVRRLVDMTTDLLRLSGSRQTDQYGPYYRPIWAILLFHKTYKSHKLHKHCKPTATLLTQGKGAQERLFAG